MNNSAAFSIFIIIKHILTCMIEGFVSIYRDDKQQVHLFFYPGIKDNKPIYNKIDLNNSEFEFDETTYEDGSSDFIFYDTNIKTIHCKLVPHNHDYSILLKTLKI